MLAITVCDMNQARSSVVKTYPKSSPEYAAIKSLCKPSGHIYENRSNSESVPWETFYKVLENVTSEKSYQKLLF